MFKRLFLLAVLAALLLSVTAVYADSGVISVPTKNYGDIGFMNDGRLNGADLSAPVAVYYKYETVRKPGDWKAAFYEEKSCVASNCWQLAPRPATARWCSP